MSEKKKMNQRGFTLVELIVVLVILAILAAMLVPALLGYIDKAREKQYALEARSIYEATQIYISQEYGKGNLKTGTEISEINETTSKGGLEQISRLTDLEVKSVKDITYSSSRGINGMTVVFVSASNGNEITGVLADSIWNFTE